MFEFPEILSHLDSIQWFAAIAFVPLVCWHQGLRLSQIFRMLALVSGYAVQIGFFLLLDDVGFQFNVLILIASIAAYFWITSIASAWSEAKTKDSAATQPEPSASNALT